ILLKYVKIKDDVKASNKLDGKSFCFTGSFDSPTRKEMENIVLENGGKISSVSKNLTALVWDGEIMKGKYDKAQKLGVNVITQEDFLKMV
ncbi:MAG: BRCT domain-containing protein, partial [Synergistaceae bacterium]